jgi:hypothetical protein
MLRSDMSEKGQPRLASASAAAVPHFCHNILILAAELTIYHQEQELRAEKEKFRSSHTSSAAHSKGGWGSKLGLLAWGNRRDTQADSCFVCRPIFLRIAAGL